MILWLADKSLLKSGAIRAIISGTLAKQGVPHGSIVFNSLHLKSPLLADADEKKIPDKFATNQAMRVLDHELDTLEPKLIVVNDTNTLRVITGKKYTLSTTNSSLYWYRGIPVLVCDTFGSVRYRKYGKFVYELTLQKIARWATGEQKNEPAFDYIVCKTVGQVLAEVEAAKSSSMVAEDTETAGGFITCCSFTYDTPEGRLRTFVIPFFDPHGGKDGAYWATFEEEVKVRKAIADLQSAPVFKCMQNGAYDNAYFVKEKCPPANYFIDTQIMMHSIWVEAPRALHNIASYFCDYYTYWKDESKGVKEDGFGKSRDELERYWRYNCLDSYYTYLSAFYLLAKITKLPWALRNYDERIALSNGPCLAAALRGIKVSRTRHAQIMREQSVASQNGIADVRRLSGEEDFNINSSNDVAWLLYDILGAKKTRIQRAGSKYNARSTDEKVLKLMKEQGNFFVTHAINRILKAKKPGGVLSKYGDMKELCYAGSDRFLSWLGAASTETSRFNSGSSQFWTGTNAQNIPPNLREMFVADDGYVLYDVDFSASDDRFIAYESQDDKKIELVESGKDPHCYHASVFFSIAYEKLYDAWKANEPWCVDSTTGVRQNTKRVTHGKNFMMGAPMMYNVMGREAVVATALALGYKNAHSMDDKALIGICQILCDKYDNPRTGLYKRIRPWQQEIAATCSKADGLATTAFGFTRKFFGDAETDHNTQRELAAFYGQGDTAGNVNRSLRKVFYSGIDDGKKCLFLLQVHDNFLFAIRKDCIHDVVHKINAIMEEPVEIHGRKMRVPVVGELGLTWGKKMVPYSPDVTYEQILAFEKKTFEKKYPTTNVNILEQLNSMNFDEAALADLEERLAFLEPQDGLDQTEDFESLENESE